MKLLFIGNRFNVLEEIQKIYGINIDILSLKDSALDSILLRKGISCTSYAIEEKDSIIDKLVNDDYDVLISNGCPFVIPVRNISTKKILINIHPTYLPELRGKTPLNGVFFNKIDHIGATMHYISPTIDGGNIIYQEKQKITEDLDQGLIYFMSFMLEAAIFKKGWKILKNNNFKYLGSKQNLNEGSCFNRTPEKMVVDLLIMDTLEIIKRVKSFGILGQGCEIHNCKCAELKRMYDAQIIINPYLLNKYKNIEPGSVVLEYDSKYLIKTLDGLIKVIGYET